jgi:hypothetical protein
VQLPFLKETEGILQGIYKTSTNYRDGKGSKAGHIDWLFLFLKFTPYFSHQNTNIDNLPKALFINPN